MDESLGIPSRDEACLVVRALFDAINSGRWDDAANLLAPDAIDHTGAPGQAPGRDGWTQRWQGMAKMLPDMRTQIEEMVEADGLVATRSRVTATPAAGFMGGPGGRSFDALAFDMMRVRDGQIVEHWGVGDFAAIVQQLGLKVVPST
jgi:predicted ester cyclase